VCWTQRTHSLRPYVPVLSSPLLISPPLSLSLSVLKQGALCTLSADAHILITASGSTVTVLARHHDVPTPRFLPRSEPFVLPPER